MLRKEKQAAKLARRLERKQERPVLPAETNGVLARESVSTDDAGPAIPEDSWNSL
jgi:hypothetical protein